MGCDGGSIPTRQEQVKTRKKEKRLDDESDSSSKWKVCSLSSLPLKAPIVCDRLGNLFNKSVLLEAMISKSLDGYPHIRSLKVSVFIYFLIMTNFNRT